MGSILNGIALARRLTRVYGGTFLIFSDYMRPAVRLAALMQLPVTYVWTHDSIGLGEDGPTHQPVEHLAVAARHPRPRRRPPRRRQRDRRGVADDPASTPTAPPASRSPGRTCRPSPAAPTACASTERRRAGGYVLVDAAEGRRRPT